uniref:Post-GPI attachment to proteins factor 3 n=1 Tax=Alexandrium monilatum TaxID=311494 RepID=A0A7S4PVU1_9DINO|mmetsp:Transcript_61002/g.191818  ORF Transcript_61002/g.191818 Transcript_61002/m.191818 type:complete len:360 (+) Transcript_61002:138-1217(+)
MARRSLAAGARSCLHAPMVGAAVASATFACSTGAFLAISDEAPWGKTKKKSSYCEGIDADSKIRQPVNSWSNLAYVAAGGWVLGRTFQVAHARSQQNVEACGGVDGARPLSTLELTLPTLLMAALGLSDTSLGVFSFLFHASMTRLWQQLDVGGMYWAMNASLLATGWRWCAVCASRAPRSVGCMLLLLALLATADGLMLAYKWQMSAAVVFTAQVVVVVTSEFSLMLASAVHLRGCDQATRAANCRSLGLGIAALLLTIAGYLLREGGVRAARTQRRRRAEGSDFCDVGSLFQPHALWHVLSGAGLLLLHEVQARPAVCTCAAAAAPAGGDSGGSAELEAAVLGHRRQAEDNAGRQPS